MRAAAYGRSFELPPHAHHANPRRRQAPGAALFTSNPIGVDQHEADNPDERASLVSGLFRFPVDPRQLWIKAKQADPQADGRVS